MYVLLGDGECNEGSVWEAAMSASQFGLNNIIAVVDNNGFQSDGSTEDIITSSTLAEKWRAFGWFVREVDGHDVRALLEALMSERPDGAPTCIVAKTVKGKGIDFMENNNEWHHNRLTQTSFEKATESLGKAQ
jgi:transketolase